MKIFAFAVLFALPAAAVSAGGLPSLPFVYPSAQPWTGFYVGANFGRHWSRASKFQIEDAFSLTAPLADGGFVRGGQIGHNWQLASNVVAGVEGDYQITSGNRAAGQFVSAGFTGASAAPGSYFRTLTSLSASIDDIGTLRGRLGSLVTPDLLVFGTGGIAFGYVRTALASTSALVVGSIQIPSALGSGTASVAARHSGWTFGGGTEWLAWPSVSVKAEYLHFDLGVTRANVGAASVSEGFSGAIFRGGVSYHFNL